MSIIDYKSNIKFILENWNNLNLTDKELNTLLETVDFLKLQVQQKVIQQNIAENDVLREHIKVTRENLINKLQDLEINLHEQELELDAQFPAYDPSEKPNGVSDSLYNELESKKMIGYETNKKKFESKKILIAEKIEAYKNMISKIEPLINSLDDPQQFITKMVEANDSQQYNYLMNQCAINMANAHMDMEHIGKSPLFLHNSDSMFDGYVPNPEAIDGFFDLIRNPQLIEELSKYNELLKKEKSQEKSLYKKQSELDMLSNIEKSLKVPDKQSIEFESNATNLVNEITYTTNHIKNIEEKLCANKLPTKTNALTNFFNRITGKTRKITEANKSLESELDEANKKLDELNLEKNSLLEKSPYYHFLKDWDLLEIHVNKNGLHEFILSECLEAKKGTTENVQKSNLEYQAANKAVHSCYEELSDRAKELANNGVGTYGLQLKSKYVDRTADTRYGIPPFTASLILEAVLKSKDIKTVDQLKELGISITKEDITELDVRNQSMEEKIAKTLINYNHISIDEQDAR